MVVDKIALPFKIFSGEGGTDLDIKTGLIKGGAETAEVEVEQAVTAAVVVEFILTLAPSAFTRLGIFSKLTTGTGTLENKRTHTHNCLLWYIWSTENLHSPLMIEHFLITYLYSSYKRAAGLPFGWEGGSCLEKDPQGV